MPLVFESQKRYEEHLLPCQSKFCQRCADGREKNGERDLMRLCQGVSPNDESCSYPATVHCATCDKWFCDTHAEDEKWHPCMLGPGEEGGEA